MRAPLVALLLLASGWACAQPQQREYIYGAELMSAEEREQYRQDSRQADEPARAQFRERHRTRLRERARQRGVQLREPHGIVEPAKKK